MARTEQMEEMEIQDQQDLKAYQEQTEQMARAEQMEETEIQDQQDLKAYQGQMEQMARTEQMEHQELLNLVLLILGQKFKRFQNRP